MTPPIPTPDQLAELEKRDAVSDWILQTLVEAAEKTDKEPQWLVRALHELRALRNLAPALIAATRRLHQLEGEPKGAKPATKNKTRDTVASYCTRTGEIS